MKPGDLVEIIDYGGYYTCDPPKIGMIVSFSDMLKYHAHVLVDGTIEQHDFHSIRPIKDEQPLKVFQSED